MALAPLSPEAVALLARGSSIDPGHLYRKTAGNPFFVTEVLRSGLGGVPATVRDAVLARAARLSAAARDALDAAAICGLIVETWLLESITGLGRSRASASGRRGGRVSPRARSGGDRGSG
jgi:hypothetical protein